MWFTSGPKNNRDCSKTFINMCTKNLELEDISNAVFTKISPYSVVFTLNKESDPSVKYSIKCIITNHEKNPKYMEFTEEIKYSHMAEKLNTGPPVYDYFYYTGEKNNLIQDLSMTEFLGKIISMIPPYAKEQWLISEYVDLQFIVTKNYRVNCRKFLLSDLKHVLLAQKTDVIGKVCKLVEKQINNKLYCKTVSLNDFAIDQVHKELSVKMTNFDQNICTDRDYKIYVWNDYPTKPYHDVKNFTSLDMFRVSLLIQIFILCARDVGKFESDKQWIYEGFRSTYLEKFLLRHDWEEIITKYTNNAQYFLDHGDASYNTHYIYTSEARYIHYVSSTIDTYDKIRTDHQAQMIITVVNLELNNLKKYLMPEISTLYLPVALPTQLHTGQDFKVSLEQLDPEMFAENIALMLLDKARSPSGQQPHPQPHPHPQPQPKSKTKPQITDETDVWWRNWGDKLEGNLTNVVLGTCLVGLTGYALYGTRKYIFGKRSRQKVQEVSTVHKHKHRSKYRTKAKRRHK